MTEFQRQVFEQSFTVFEDYERLHSSRSDVIAARELVRAFRAFVGWFEESLSNVFTGQPNEVASKVQTARYEVDVALGDLRARIDMLDAPEKVEGVLLVALERVKKTCLELLD